MTKIEKILCSVDRGDGTSEICSYAAGIARSMGAAIVLYHVAESLQEFQRHSGQSAARLGAHGEVEAPDGTSPLKALQDKYFDDMPSESHVELGSPAESIARYARAHGCGMIVTGSPRTGLSAMMRPSVGRRVQKISGLPVTMVGVGADETAINAASPLTGLAW